MVSPGSPSLADLVNTLFERYRHPSGREYTNREVVEGITRRAGERLLEESSLSRIRNGERQRPAYTAVEALCLFFPVDTAYFFPRVAALRERMDQRQGELTVAMRQRGIDPHLLHQQLALLIEQLEAPAHED